MLSIVTGQDKIGYSLEKENCWPQQLDAGLSKQHIASKKACEDNESDRFVKLLMAFHQQKNVVMDENLLHLISLASEHVLNHMEDLVVVEPLCQELWNLGKRLKQDTEKNKKNEDQQQQQQQQQDVYGNAVLVMIYHCRGSIHYNQKDWARVINDCRKCLAIDLQTDMLMSSDSLLLQKVGLIQENATSMLEQGLRYQRRCLSSGSSSSISSISTQPSSMMTMMVCSFCSVEKRKMPVCAQCKYQAYCGIKCLKQDKARHASECQHR